MSTTGIQSSGWNVAVAAAHGDVPILGIHALRYEAEGRPGLLPPIAGLRVSAQGVVGATPRFDAASGQTLFPDLPPGPRRILVTDPEHRVLPAAIEVDIPPRHGARPTLGPAMATGAPPRRAVLLRPHPARAVPDGVTALIGTVRDAEGRAVPLTRIALVTAFDGRAGEVVCFSAQDGAFVVLLPGEPRATAPMLRAISVTRPVARLAAALAADFLSALPAGPEGTPPASLFAPTRCALHAPDGTPAEAAAGQVLLRAGRTTRWDIVLGG